MNVQRHLHNEATGLCRCALMKGCTGRETALFRPTPLPLALYPADVVTLAQDGRDASPRLAPVAYVDLRLPRTKRSPQPRVVLSKVPAIRRRLRPKTHASEAGACAATMRLTRAPASRAQGTPGARRYKDSGLLFARRSCVN